MSDLLQQLRLATIQGVSIQNQDGHYIIANQRYHEGSKTIFKRTLKSDDYHYSLKDIIFFLENASLPVAEYRRKAVEARIPAVVEQDRHALQQYLTGKIEHCPQLDFEAAAVIASDNAKLAGKDSSSKSAKKDSNKRKHSAIQPEGYQINSEDNSVLQLLRADEHTPFSRQTVFNAVGTDFAIALKLFNDKVLKPKEEPDNNNNNGKKSGNPSHLSSSAAEREGEKRPKSNTLIILVPAALTSTITMFNAKEFLETGNLNIHEQMPEGKKPKFEILLRKLADNSTATCKITDDPSRFTSDDWERVVAVFVTGQTWQFRGWKYENPADLFQHVLGVHLMFDDRHAPPTIQSWNCKLLKVNQYKQHLNAGALREFWMMVDDHLKLSRS